MNAHDKCLCRTQGKASQQIRFRRRELIKEVKIVSVRPSKYYDWHFRLKNQEASIAHDKISTFNTFDSNYIIDANRFMCHVLVFCHSPMIILSHFFEKDR